ncbi:MAG: class I SAM-dependent methyltransferase, partial [Promethearchaeota archaeon]
GQNFTLLDICSALGGPARHLAEKYGINVVGLDITPEMVLEAKKRTEGKPYANKIEYRIGSGLDIPAHQNSFEIVWGQDAWCYIRDKVRLIEETWRVLKPGGTIAFTDWIWGPKNVSEKESDFLMEFMVFPNLQTLDGYAELLKATGYQLVEKEDLQEDFAKNLDIYVDILQKAKLDIEAGFGRELYVSAEEGVLAWQKAAHEKKVGRGLWIAKKP